MRSGLAGRGVIWKGNRLTEDDKRAGIEGGISSGSHALDAHNSAGSTGRCPIHRPTGPSDWEVELANQANLEEGYVALYRSSLRHDLFLKKPGDWWKIWTYMLMRANRIERQVDTDAGPITLPIGSFIGSLRTIARHTSTSISTTRCCLRWFEKNKMTAQSTAQLFTVYHVVNFGFYQPHPKSTEQSTAQTEHTRSTPAAHPQHKTIGNREEVENINREILGDSAGPNAPFSLTAETSDNGTRAAKPKTTYTREFSEWWEHHWRGANKHAASLAYGGALRYVMGQCKCTDAQAHARLISWAKEEPGKSAVPGNQSRAAMHESTWLNGRRWEDEIREIRIEPEAGGDAFSRMVREGKFKGAVLP